MTAKTMDIQIYTAIHYIVLEEDLTKGQRIESFVLGTRNAQNAEGLLIPFYEGTTVLKTISLY